MLKTKGHATTAAIESGISTYWEKAANNSADRLAKAGARLHHLKESQALQYRAFLDAACEVAIFIAQTQGMSEKLPARDCSSRPEPRVALSEEEQPEPEPVLILEGPRMPATCPPVGVPGSSRKAHVILQHHLLTAEVIGDVGSRTNSTAITFCSRCGAFGAEKLEALTKTCRGESASSLSFQSSPLKTGPLHFRNCVESCCVSLISLICMLFIVVLCLALSCALLISSRITLMCVEFR